MTGVKKDIIYAAFVFVSIVCAGMIFSLEAYAQADKTKVELTQRDRVIILAPHPDDEVIGCAGIIQEARKMDLPVRIVYFTYGDNNQWSFLVYRKHPVFMPKAVRAMGQVRHEEAIQAALALGLKPGDLTFLGYPDYRTLDIWCAHWGDRPPAKSMLTEVTAIPYKNALRPGTPYKGEEVLKDLEAIFREFKPTKIFLSHPGDHNPDHRSLYLFTRVALWVLKKENIKAELFPYIIHVAGWPLPRGYYPNVSTEPPDIFATLCEWKYYVLDRDQIRGKHAALRKHKSQYDSSPDYLLSFVRSNEMFGDPPPIELGSEPARRLQVLDGSGKISEELTDEEKAAFVGIEERSVSIRDSDVVMTIKLSKPLGETVGLSAYLFGYREDKDFSTMPKLHIKFGVMTHQILDQDKKVSKKNIKKIMINRHPKEIELSVPLELLGDPQKILTTAQTYTGRVPLDWVSWRIVELNRK